MPGATDLTARTFAVSSLAALLVLAVAGVLQSSRGLWQDEATLLANFGLPLSTYLRSLPFYDQAVPPFALLTLDATYLVAQASVQATRLILLSLNLVLMGGLALAAYRRADRPALLAVAMIAVTPLAIRYCIDSSNTASKCRRASCSCSPCARRRSDPVP